jgi:hypothetical protein
MTQLDAWTDRPAGDEADDHTRGPPGGPPARVWSRIRPVHVALAILFMGALWVAVTPINDIDSYWHVAIGREILTRHGVDGLGRQWLGVDAPGWRTSQWLSEVGMYLAVDHFGWLALPALRVVMGCALFAVYAATLIRRRHPVASFIVVFLLVVGLEPLLQDRPATLSLVFLAALAAACERLWTTGLRPAPVLVAVTCLVWAQLHGLWVLAPVAFLLVALGGVLDHEARPPGQVSGALVCAAASCAGLVNPQGPASFLLPLRFRTSGESSINEWAPTSFTMSLTAVWGLLLCLLVLAWVRSARRVPATELLWVFVWTAFGVLALRNVGPAALMTAPVALRAVESSLAGRLRSSPVGSRREGHVLAGLLAVVVLGGGIVVGSSLSRVNPLQDTPALTISRRLATVDRPLRIWNGYNSSGSLIAFGGGGTGHLRLVIDGRSDLWGSEYIAKVMDTQELTDDWQRSFEDFRPDAVLLGAETPLVVYLERAEHWQVAQRDRSYVLLVPPGRSL